MNFLMFKLVGFIKKVTGLSRRIDAAIQEFVEEFPEFLNLMAEGYRTSDAHLDEFTRKEQLLKRFVTHDKMMFGKRCVFRVHGLWSLAQFYRERYRHGDAERIFGLCADLLFTAAENENTLPFEFRKRIVGIVDFLRGYSKYAAAEAMLRRCLDNPKLTRTDDEVAEDLERLAQLCAKNGKGAEAVTHLETLRTLLEPKLGADSLALVELLEKQYWLLKEIGDEAALKRCKAQLELLHSIVINDKALGQDHVSNQTPLRDLARFYAQQGKHDLAERMRTRADIAQLANKTKGLPYPGLARDLRQLAGCYRKRGEGGDGTLAFHADRKADLLSGKVRR